MVDQPLTEPWTDALARADSETYFEQRLYARSPFSLLTTTAILFAAILALYAVVAFLDHTALLVHTRAGIFLDKSFRIAATLDLVICVALGVQRYARIKDCEDGASLFASMKPGTPPEMQLSGPNTRGLKLWRANVAGMALGGALSLLLYWRSATVNPQAHLAMFLYFSAAIVALTLLFARGVELTRAGSRGAREVLRDHLQIDLLRIDLLSGWGRTAARTSLVWFSVSAAACLLFIDRTDTLYTAVLLLACAAMGVWVFVGTMMLVHRKIQAAKKTELERLRKEVDTLRHQIHVDPNASLKLQGLLAYEARIASAPEWPFDQTTAMRVGASALILTVPWFGQALAQSLIEHLGQVVR